MEELLRQMKIMQDSIELAEANRKLALESVDAAKKELQLAEAMTNVYVLNLTLRY
jgi:hypothetical protein